MADYTDTSFYDSFNSRVRDSNNTTNTNTSSTLGVDLNQVGNTDSSTNDSNNLSVGLDGVGNVDSHDMSSDNSGSFNDWSDNSVYDGSDNSVYDGSDNSTTDNSDNSTTDNSDNSMTDGSDNSINGSYNDGSTNSITGSYNSYLDESMDDHSVDVGTRDYSTGIGSLGLGGGGGGGGDTWVNNQNTIVDQSYNASIGGEDGYGADSHGAGGDSWAVVASGDGSIAAGNDVDISHSVDHSTTISGGGDVNIGNETHVLTITDSYNETTDDSSWTDSSEHLDVHDSYNTDASNWTADNSFNDELTSQTDDTWNVDADVIWGSSDAVIADSPTVDDAFDES